VLDWKATTMGDFFVVLLDDDAVEPLLIHVDKKDPNPRGHKLC
jgi:hypothetical protein